MIWILTALNIIAIVAVVAVFILLIKLKGAVDMLKLTKDNPVVGAWFTWVMLYDNPIESVPTQWNLRALVQERIDDWNAANNA